MNARDDQIVALRGNAARLSEDRLKDCYDEILQGYRSETIVDSIARVILVPDRTPSDFRVLTNSEARPIEHFNDSAYYWGMYCSQLGRSIAFGEMRHMFEELQALDPDGDPIDARTPNFSGLARAAMTLRSSGLNPDTLCAPIGLFVPFAGDGNLKIDWSSSPKEVVVLPDGSPLNLFWSSGAAPLNRFVVLDSSRMTWNVKPDSLTEERLTIAIGESTIATGERAVVFLAETVAKFDVDPDAAFVIPLEGEPFDPEEYVNRELTQELNHG